MKQILRFFFVLNDAKKVEMAKFQNCLEMSYTRPYWNWNLLLKQSWYRKVGEGLLELERKEHSYIWQESWTPCFYTKVFARLTVRYNILPLPISSNNRYVHNGIIYMTTFILSHKKTVKMQFINFISNFFFPPVSPSLNILCLISFPS